MILILPRIATACVILTLSIIAGVSPHPLSGQVDFTATAAAAGYPDFCFKDHKFYFWIQYVDGSGRWAYERDPTFPTGEPLVDGDKTQVGVGWCYMGEKVDDPNMPIPRDQDAVLHVDRGPTESTRIGSEYVRESCVLGFSCAGSFYINFPTDGMAWDGGQVATP